MCQQSQGITFVSQTLTTTLTITKDYKWDKTNISNSNGMLCDSKGAIIEPLEHSTMTVHSGYGQFQLLNEIHFLVIYTICLVFSIWRIERRKEELLGYWVSLEFFYFKEQRTYSKQLNKWGQAGVIKRVQGHLANQIIDFQILKCHQLLFLHYFPQPFKVSYLLLPEHLLLSNFYRLDSSGRLK